VGRVQEKLEGGIIVEMDAKLLDLKNQKRITSQRYRDF
jgi:hypothetical protein